MVDGYGDASANSPYIINVLPGVYAENLTLTPYCVIYGEALSTVEIQGNIDVGSNSKYNGAPLGFNLFQNIFILGNVTCDYTVNTPDGYNLVFFNSVFLDSTYTLSFNGGIVANFNQLNLFDCVCNATTVHQNGAFICLNTNFLAGNTVTMQSSVGQGGFAFILGSTIGSNMTIDGTNASIQGIMTNSKILGTLTIDNSFFQMDTGSLPFNPPGGSGTVIKTTNAYSASYTPSNPADWSIQPTDVQEGLDILASAVAGGGGGSVTLSNLPGGGNDVLSNPGTGSTFDFRTVSAAPGGILSTNQTADNIEFLATADVQNNPGGTGSQLVTGTINPSVYIKTLSAGNGLGINDSGTDIAFANNTNLVNQSLGGFNLVTNPTPPNYGIKGIKAGTNVTITDDGTDLTIDSSGSGSVTMSNPGLGTAVLANPGIGNSFNFKSLVNFGAQSPLSLGSNATQVNINCLAEYLALADTSATWTASHTLNNFNFPGCVYEVKKYFSGSCPSAAPGAGGFTFTAVISNVTAATSSTYTWTLNQGSIPAGFYTFDGYYYAEIIKLNNTQILINHGLMAMSETGVDGINGPHKPANISSVLVAATNDVINFQCTGSPSGGGTFVTKNYTIKRIR